jgi:hypothetical protein
VPCIAASAVARASIRYKEKSEKTMNKRARNALTFQKKKWS